MIFEDDVLVFDCDGVLVCLNEGSLAACAAASGRPADGMEWSKYDHFVEFGLNHGQFLQALIDHKVLETAKLMPGVRAAIHLARASGLKTAVVTARGFHPNPLVTEQYFRSHGVTFDHIAVVGDKESKVDVIKSLGRIVGYAEDLSSHLTAARAGGIDCPMYLRSQPWNTGAVGFERVASVPEVVQKVLEHRAAHASRHRMTA